MVSGQLGKYTYTWDYENTYAHVKEPATKWDDKKEGCKLYLL